MSELKFSEIQRKFDKLVDIDEILYYLRDIFNLFSVCSTATCDVNHNLHELGLMREIFPAKTIAKIRELKKNETEMQKWENEYDEYVYEANRILSELFALKIAKETVELEKKIKHERKVEIVREFVKSKIPIPSDFTMEMSEYIDSLSEVEKVKNNAKDKMKTQAE